MKTTALFFLLFSAQCLFARTNLGFSPMSWAVTRSNTVSASPEAKLESGMIAKKIPLERGYSTNTSRLLSSEVVNRGSSQKVIRDIRETPAGDGTFVRRTNSYTKLGSGLCYRQANGQWTDSNPEIVIDSSGKGVGQKAANSAKFGANLNSAGVVELMTPSGKKFRSHVLGVSLHDAKSGKSVQVGQLQDSIGTIVGGEEVIYANAFTGINADVRYRYKRNGMSQDVIFKDALPSPAEFGMDTRTTSVEVWTEFLESPQPLAQGKAPLENGRENIQTLEFGDIRIGQGRAFLAATEGDLAVRPAAKYKDKQALPVNPHSIRNAGTSVRKEWLTLEGRTFLIESVPYQDVKLPRRIVSPDPGATPVPGVPKRSANSITPASESVARVADGTRVPPKTFFSSINTSNRINFAAHFPMVEGYVLDYEMIETLPELTLWSDTTYLIQDVVSVTSLTVEGGTVVKFDQDAELEVSYIDCKTAPYRPAVFTSKNDDSIGEPIAHLPTETADDCRGAGIFFTWTYAPRDIHDLRMMWLNWPLVFDSPLYVSQPTIRNCQFVHCGVVASVTTQQNAEIPDMKFQNCLVSQCYSLSGGGARVSSEHVTLDQITTMGCGSEQLTVNIYNSSATEDATIWIYDSDAAVDWDTDGWNVWPVFSNPSQVHVDGGVIGSTMSQSFVFAAQAGKSYTMWGHGQWFQLQTFGCTFQPMFDLLSLSINGDGELSGSVSGVSLCPTLVSMTNCILANVGNAGTLSGNHNGFYNSASFGSNPVPVSESPFQVSGGGNYYLKDNSTFRRAGTASVSTTMLNSLKRKTTTPPIDFPRLIRLTGELSLFPQIPRYVSGVPDLGYYYDVVDYTVAAMFVDGGNVTVNPGTVVGSRQEHDPVNIHHPYWPGWFNGWTQLGICVTRGGSLISHGKPGQRNVFTDVQMVQEAVAESATFLFVSDLFGPLSFGYGLDRPAPVMEFDFSDFSVSQGCVHLANGFSSAIGLTVKNCNVHGGWFSITEGSYGELNENDVIINNTLFDTVQVTFSPELLWGFVDPVDLAVIAHNNLFRRGSLLTYPQGIYYPERRDWVFKDNLFDKVEFIFIEPVTGGWDRDYNAYHLLSESELRMNGQTTPGTLSANEIALGSELAYQTGPMGAYYLPTSSTLWNAGSRTAADAGLFHYTTRVDQTKEGSEGSGNLVNIGLHYVATPNSGSTLPKDTDADGVSDSVEDQNGDGVVDANETNPTLAQTETGVPDASSTKYDDIDLDGDGMVGRIEKALTTNPLVSDNPLTMTQRTLVEPGIYSFKVDINHGLLVAIGGINLNLNGAAATMTDDLVAADGKSLLRWNTTFDPPGQNFLQAQLGILSQDSETSVLAAFGPIYPFYSDNVLQFSENGCAFDDSGAYVDADLPVIDATYTIDLYDASTGSPTFIRTIGPNTTSDGTIQVDWNVTQADNTTPFTGDTVNAVYNVTLLDGSGAAIASGSATKILKRPPGALSEFSPNINFAYMYIRNDGALYSAYKKNGVYWNLMQGVVDVLIAPRWPWSVYNSYFNRYLPDPQGEYPGFLEKRSDVTGVLFNVLGGSRQFYCSSHGDASGIRLSAGVYGPDGLEVHMDVDEVGNLLGNKEISRRGMQIWNPYRFVFLDACYSARTRRWHRAFGIIPMNYSFSRHAARSRVGPQAFVGWADTVSSFTQNIDTLSASTEALDAFYVAWMSGQPLANCILSASDKTLLDCPFPLVGNEAYTVNGIPYSSKTSKIYVVGHSGLTITGLNPSFDNLYRPPYQH